MRWDGRELRLSERSGNGLCSLERLVEGISDPLHFDLSEAWELFEPFRGGVGDIGEALA